jgi:hypothetical protein
VSKEKVIELQILEYLNKQFGSEGYFHKIDYPIRFKHGKAISSSHLYVIEGVSDIIGVYKGQFVAIEVKTSKERDRIKNHFKEYYGRTNDRNTDIRRYSRQIQYLEIIRRKGGRSGFAASLQEAVRVLTTPVDKRSLNFFFC